MSKLVTDIFFEIQDGGCRHLGFPVMWIWQFWHLDSVVFVFWTKFGSNTCYSYWDRRTYASDVHLMTSRELTSGFDFWSRGHLRMTVMHIPIKFGADIFIQSGVIDIFSKFKMAAAAILDFQICVLSTVFQRWKLSEVKWLTRIVSRSYCSAEKRGSNVGFSAAAKHTQQFKYNLRKNNTKFLFSSGVSNYCIQKSWSDYLRVRYIT